jgi:uncharacterized protein DUF6188
MTLYLSHLHGQSLASVGFDADTREWVFTFTGHLTLQVAAPWRMVSEEVIALGYEDNGHLFGLQTPVDANEWIQRATAGREVTEAAVNTMGDLDLRFGCGPLLQVFNASCGYEGWQLFGPGDRWVVAHGGGRVIDSQREC